MKICLNPAKKDFTSFWVCKHLKAGQSAKHPLSFFAVKNSKTPYLQKNPNFSELWQQDSHTRALVHLWLLSSPLSTSSTLWQSQTQSCPTLMKGNWCKKKHMIKRALIKL